VVIDGLYSWEEYTLLKEHYNNDLLIVAVYASPKTRYARLDGRRDRTLTPVETTERDRAEIVISHKGGPIAVADYTIINESSLEDLSEQTERIIEGIR
jgi:dephospho-CoA kinase